MDGVGPGTSCPRTRWGADSPALSGAVSVVDLLDEERNPMLHVFYGPVLPQIDLFGFERLHKTLGSRIVVRVAFARHTGRSDRSGESHLAGADGAQWLSARHSDTGPYRSVGKVRTDGAPGTAIQNHSQADEGAPQSDIGHVSHPHLIQGGGGPVREQIGGDRERRRAVGGTHPMPAWPTKPAALAHQPEHLLMVHAEALAMQLRGDVAVPIIRRIPRPTPRSDRRGGVRSGAPPS